MGDLAAGEWPSFGQQVAPIRTGRDFLKDPDFSTPTQEESSPQQPLDQVALDTLCHMA